MLVGDITSSWLVQIRDAGHGLMYQYPEKFSKVIQIFLDIIKQGNWNICISSDSSRSQYGKEILVASSN